MKGSTRITVLAAAALIASLGAAHAAETGSTQGGEKKLQLRQDRIKAVQRKVFLKKHRWSLTPLFLLSLNDAFYQKMAGGVSAAYHVADSLGLEVQAVFVGTIQTDMVTFFQQANQALPKVSQLRYYITANAQWSPIYGKLALFSDSIVHFDAYLVGGFGLAQTETGPKFASNVGFGLRYYATSWLVVKLEVRDIIYTEKLRLDVQRADFTDIQNHVMLGAGVSFFLPTSFNYEFQ